jgi:hypothetical protein
MKINEALAVSAVTALSCIIATAAQSQVRVTGSLTTITLPAQSSQFSSSDFANAKPMPMPAARALPPSGAAAISSAVDPLVLFGEPGGLPGDVGTGRENPIQLVPPQNIPQRTGIESGEFGTSGQPYTTSEVNAYGDLTQNYYPFRAAGKLNFFIGNTPYYCSASLIAPGVVLAAAHCVANCAQKQFYSGWTYVPAYNGQNGAAPYGTWTAQSVTILSAYYGTGAADPDNCYQIGVICPDDVALITVYPQNGQYPGTATGWFGFGYNGYSYNGAGQALITQLGYPADLDMGFLMQRNDSQGFVYAPFSNNTIVGTLFTPGSSGGPWVVNLGAPPALSGGDSYGAYGIHNIVVGVTSWVYTDLAVKQEGASPFTSGNILPIYNAVCSAYPSAC